MNNPIPAPATPPDKSNTNAMIGGVLITLLVIGSAYIAWPYVKNLSTPNPASGGGTDWVVLDSDRLLKAQLVLLIQLNQGDPKTFADRYRAAITDLASEGKVVINARNLMAYPKDLDYTDRIAKRLGIDLDLADRTEKATRSTDVPPAPARDAQQ